MADRQQGWILLYRSIRDSWIWEEKPFSFGQAWVDLILDVNHEDRKVFINGQLIVVKRGQKWTSLRVLAARWGWRQEKVLNFMRALEQDGMITRKVTRSGALLTIVNYGKFQDSGYTNRHTNEDTNDTPVKTQAIHQRITNNNDNNDLIMTNNENKIIPAPPHGGGEWQ
jgi:DNA replication protein DnaD